MCDEPVFCESGTDTSDCAALAAQNPQPQNGYTGQATPFAQNSDAGNTCQWAHDNECDEPTYCAFGTDTADCQSAQSRSPSMAAPSQAGFADSCRYAFDGMCDEPTFCDFGTDKSDCGY